MSRLILHELTGSPNNVKVRIALGYKGLDYERRPIDLDGYPGDRTSVVRRFRQTRLPALEHGDVRIFDSAAILRYLEANFHDTPPIFTDDFDAHREIEEWELYARTQLGEPVGMVFEQAFAPAPDTEALARANRLVNERTAKIEERLVSHDVLVGDHVTAADIVCAAPLYLIDLTEEHAASGPIAAFFRTHFKLGEGREKTLAWVRRLMAYDAVLGRPAAALAD